MEEKIYSANLQSGASQKTLLAEGVVTPDGIAVDWVHSRLYWTDTGANTISAADFDGQNRILLIKDSVEEPRAIVLHPGKG